MARPTYAVIARKLQKRGLEKHSLTASVKARNSSCRKARIRFFWNNMTGSPEMTDAAVIVEKFKPAIDPIKNPHAPNIAIPTAAPAATRVINGALSSYK